MPKNYQIGDRVLSSDHPNLSLTLIWTDPDGEWCRCRDDYGTELYACAELLPDDF